MPDAPPADPMLQLFVRLMNSLDVQLGLTVLVGGSWVSGILIPPRTFTEEAGNDLVEKAGADAEGIQVFFRELGRQWFPTEAEREAEPEGTAPGPNSAAGAARREDRPYHLHFRSARLVTTTGTIPVDGAYMRIRLAEVTGWVIGDFSSTHPFRPPIPPQHTDS